MQSLPRDKWEAALQRVTQRYAGRSVILREQLPGEEPHLVLWRTPLRGVTLEEDKATASITVLAGHEEPWITVRFTAIQQVQAQVTADQSLDLLCFTLHDGSLVTLLFNTLW